MICLSADLAAQGAQLSLQVVSPKTMHLHLWSDHRKSPDAKGLAPLPICFLEKEPQAALQGWALLM